MHFPDDGSNCHRFAEMEIRIVKSYTNRAVALRCNIVCRRPVNWVGSVALKKLVTAAFSASVVYSVDPPGHLPSLPLPDMAMAFTRPNSSVMVSVILLLASRMRWGDRVLKLNRSTFVVLPKASVLCLKQEIIAVVSSFRNCSCWLVQAMGV